MARYIHGKTTLAFTAEQKIKLETAAAVAANTRLWTLVQLKTGAEPSDASMIRQFKESSPFHVDADMPEFVWRQAIRTANRDWRLWKQDKANAPTAYGVKGSFPFRIWERVSGTFTPRSIKSEWLGEVSNFGGTPFGPYLHCVNAKRTATGWSVTFSSKVETEAKDAIAIPDTFEPLA